MNVTETVIARSRFEQYACGHNYHCGFLVGVAISDYKRLDHVVLRYLDGSIDTEDDFCNGNFVAYKRTIFTYLYSDTDIIKEFFSI
jgi:hypothetical protein